MKNIIYTLLVVLMSFNGGAMANSITNDYYKICLTVGDSCTIQYLNNDSSVVSITSPDNKSVLYFIGIHTKEGDLVYDNDLFDVFEGDYFDVLKRDPDDIKSSFFFSREDHFYNLNDSAKCHTRAFLWNSKAGLLVGFSNNGDMQFIDQCMDTFESPIALGKIGTLIWALITGAIFIILFITWEEKRFLAILLICAVAVGYYYFHWVLDISINKYIASFFG